MEKEVKNENFGQRLTNLTSQIFCINMSTGSICVSNILVLLLNTQKLENKVCDLLNVKRVINRDVQDLFEVKTVINENDLTVHLKTSTVCTKKPSDSCNFEGVLRKLSHNKGVPGPKNFKNLCLFLPTGQFTVVKAGLLSCIYMLSVSTQYSHQQMSMQELKQLDSFDIIKSKEQKANFKSLYNKKGKMFKCITWTSAMPVMRMTSESH